MKIILAQGNPGPEYSKTRHNIGFMIIDVAAEKFGAKWENKPKFQSVISEVTVANEKVLLVKPQTFYNETGIAARKIVDFYKINPAKDLLVIHDDLALPFGTIRVRKQGSDAGNNGIKSLNKHLGNDYTRIRIGINNETHNKIEDVDFVLGRLNEKETEILQKTIIPKSIEIIEQFCQNTLEITSHKIF